MAGAARNESNAKEEQESREDIQNSESSSSSSFLPELNLLFVFLSLVSPDSNEDSNGEDGELMRAKELEASATYNIARSSVKKKNVVEAKPEGRRVPQRFHTTIKDHRFSSLYQFH